MKPITIKQFAFLKDEKPVLKYTMAGVFVREYASVSQAAKQNNTSVPNITNCIKKRQKSAAGHIWKWKYKSQNKI